MASLLKLKGSEISISSANNVGLSKVVRVYNDNAASQVLTMAYANTTSYANCTIASKTWIVVQKDPTDTVQGTLLAVPVAFTY